MFKRMIFAALLALVILGTLPAAAQSSSSDWSAYLFNNFTGQLVRVYPDGRQQTYDLGIDSRASVSSDWFDFTSDGNRMVYCTNDIGGDSGGTLVIKNVDGSGTSFNHDFGPTQGCWVKYSADDSQIAVGLMRYFPGSPTADTSVPPWALLVLNAATGEQLYEMNPTKMQASSALSDSIMPEVRYFADAQIIFAALPFGTDGSPSSPAYLWQLSDGNIQPIDRWWRSDLDSLTSTRELIWTDFDPSLPAVEPSGPVPQANVVKLADKNGREQMIFTSPDWVLMSAKFIDNGREVAINEIQGTDQNRWVSLDRSGTVTELATTTGFSQLAAAPNGYVYLWASDNSATPVLTLDYHTGKQKVTLWTQQESNSISWLLLWTAPTQAANGLQPFPTVAQ